MKLPICPFCNTELTIEYREPIRDYVWECCCSIENLHLKASEVKRQFLRIKGPTVPDLMTGSALIAAPKPERT